jgi:hypothetical protein
MEGTSLGGELVLVSACLTVSTFITGGQAHTHTHTHTVVLPFQSQATSQATPPLTLPVPKGDFDVPSIPVMSVPGGVDNASTVDGIVIGLPVQDLPAAR